MITVILAAVVVLRVAWAADFDTATALAIAASLSVAQMLSGVAVVILPTVLVLLAINGVVWLVDGIRTGIDKRQLNLVLVASSLLLSLLAISALALSLWSFLLLVTVGIVIAFVRPAFRGGYKRALVPMAIVVAVGVFATSDDVWLPAEYLVSDEGRGLTGYVLNDESGWLTILMDEPRKVVLFPLDSVVSREVCIAPGENESASLIEIVRSDPPYPDCQRLQTSNQDP